MRRALLLVILVAGVAHAAGAQTFRLKYDKTGDIYGPFEFKNGEKVVIGKGSFTLIREAIVPPTLNQKLSHTVIPSIDFRNAAVRDVVRFLQQASIDYSPWGEPHNRGINVILNVKPSQEHRLPNVTFRAQKLPLGDALEAIATTARLKVRIERNIIWLDLQE